MDLTNLYKTQISLSEWFEKSGHALTKEMREEDNEKRERLKVLNDVIGLPFDKPFQFSASDIANKSENFMIFLEEHGNELCALRLIPTEANLPKLRMRGYTIKGVLKWFEEQKIELEKYRADFVQHPENTEWSTIFIVNEKGIFGEIIKGSHAQLTQGYHESEKPISFSFNFKDFKLYPEDKEAEIHLKDILARLEIDDKNKKEKLVEKLNAVFCDNYLVGYFETTSSKEFGLWFIDYNRILGNLYSDYNINLKEEVEGEMIRGLQDLLENLLERPELSRKKILTK